MKRANIKVKAGQIWRKKDTGQYGIVTAGNRKDRVMVKMLPKGNRIHGTRVKDMQMFWELVK